MTCTGVNDCTTMPPVCPANSACSQTGPGTHTCTCSTGYSPTVDNSACLQIDSCATSSPCDPHATCSSTGPALFSCKCNDGWQGDGKSCTAVDACVNGPCDRNAYCSTTGPGKVTCLCKAGYQGSGYVCTPVNACASSNPCDPHATCTSTGAGTFKCACQANWLGDGVTCKQKDMCSGSPPPCNAFATCIQTSASAITCACNAGYTGDGRVSCTKTAADTYERDEAEKQRDQQLSAVKQALEDVGMFADKASAVVAQKSAARIVDVGSQIDSLSRTAKQLAETEARQTALLKALQN